MIKINIQKEKAPDEWSEVFNYREDLKILREALGLIDSSKKNVLVVGNGGSITSFDAMSYTLKTNKKTASVWTMDPDYLEKIRMEFPPSATIVVAVSKSGNTLGQIEALLNFSDYEVLIVTEKNNGTLSKIADEMNWKTIEHPKIGGRFSGGTSSTFASAILSGIDVEKVQSGMINAYDALRDEAYSLSKYYYELEENGYNEIYISIYPERLKNFQNLIIQLMHESVCKDGKGQTFYASMAPESQHHTNQRFLGGKRNVIGTFLITKEKSDKCIKIPEQLQNIDYKGSPLSVLNGIDYTEALNAEYKGTKQDADKLNIPNITLEIDMVNENSVGELISFWQMVAFYSSILREVNPFDQPAVENSKNITLEIIKNIK